MRLVKGLPSGLSFVEERLRAVVEKLHYLDDNDIRELDAFIDYLVSGTGAGPESTDEAKSARMYDFMNGGLGKE